MPRCYMVKKQCNKYQPLVRECWGQSSEPEPEPEPEDPPGPVSPTEACVAPPYYSPGPTDTHTDTHTDSNRTSYLQEFITPAAQEPVSLDEGSGATAASVTQEHVAPSSDGDIPIFRVRSVEETEAAHDLLSLSQSLPPLQAPGVVTIYQPTAVYPEPYSPQLFVPAPAAATTTSLDAAAPTYRTASPLPVTIPCYQPQVLYVVQPPAPAPAAVITHLPTPPVSECSSDVENNNPNQPPPHDTDTANHADNISTSTYTYDKLKGTDGRSKRTTKKKITLRLEPLEDEEEQVSQGEMSEDDKSKSKGNKYVCTECGKQYATSSNLSRHKQTHRSLDSQSAKKCMTCGKAYVSMPALAMHVLTHKLAHSCGVCGKMFSRPWLLQGHLRSHTGEKPYGCAHCGKAFADRSNLRAHMQTHSADKNFECPRCHKSFALKSYLNKHLESACQRDDDDDPDESTPPLSDEN